ncbi:hypothetical protein CYY_009504 [Polysphondylium violaceum]|uniref:Nudix hydrolase domain-containing protein n=1 Tax=Polysphondylium violaceum TaxID=133409 RepID=A0A8J4PLH6_9MYCE|nr:hypothetical protein CYY_009504 [Polysphondylium violaceum]
MISEASTKIQSASYNNQAGCIPIRIKKLAGSGNGSSLLSLEDFQILLVTSGTSGENWVFPKGSIKKSESKKEAALRETMEEAGVKGKIIKALAPIDVADHHKGCNLRYFPTYVKKKQSKAVWDEKSKRHRKWYRLSDAPTTIYPLKPHIMASIVALQRSIGVYQQEINQALKLADIPFDQFPLKSIQDYIVPKKDKKKKEKEIQRKQRK